MGGLKQVFTTNQHLIKEQCKNSGNYQFVKEIFQNLIRFIDYKMQNLK